jgi:predicted extracellular nuclease
LGSDTDGVSLVRDPAGDTNVVKHNTISSNNASPGDASNPVGDAAPSVASTAPANGETGVAVDADVTITFSEAVVAASGWFTITCDTSSDHSAAVSGGPQSYTLNPDIDFDTGETCTVTVYSAQVTDTDTDDPPDAMLGNYDFSFDVDAGLVPTIIINEIHADPASGLAGDANGNGARETYGDEFVEIVNNSGSAADISGWTLSDASSVRHTFPAGTVIADQCAVVVFGNSSPSGSFGGAIVQTASGNLSLNNSGDTVTLNDGASDQDVVTYGGEGGDDQSITRDPDITGPSFVKHSTTTGSGGALFSPGTKIDGLSFPGCVLPDIPPTVASTSPVTGDTGVAVDANININFSEDVTVAGSWFDITCATSGAHTAAVSGGPQNYVLNPDTDFAPLEVCTVTVVAAQVTDQDGTPDNMAADYAFDFTTSVSAGACGDPATPIHDIQGSGMSSPEAGNIHVIEGVVVGDFQDIGGTYLGGFFLQEEDADADADPTTSEGIFVEDGASPATDVNVGDVVRVTGLVTESYGLTKLIDVTVVDVCNPGLASAAIVNLPVANLNDWEWYEGMLIILPQTLYVTENYDLGRYGEVALSVGDRLDNPTNVVEPGAPVLALQELNDRSRIQLDDGSTAWNPTPTPYIGAENTLRTGDTLLGLTGVLHYEYGDREVHPTGPVNFTRANTRDAAPPDAGGAFTVASFNVLNYFITLDDSGAICGPTGGLGCRGADNAAEFTRQRDKIIDAIVTMDADVIGLMEVENHPTDGALQDLVTGLNSVAGAGTYAYLDTGTIGTDAIKVAFIYKPATATPIGPHAILDSSVDPRFIDTKNRPALAQTFAEDATGGMLTIAVNHLKSKGSDCDALGDPDAGDGQGNCNLTRTSAAEALVDWLATDPTGSKDDDFLIIGDLNAYAMEDPIDAIKAGGYTNLIELFLGLDAYSYVFQGQAGYLDHALATASLVGQVTGVVEWHINADEPSALDYNDYNDPSLYAPGPYRASDHDPVIVGLDLPPDDPDGIPFEEESGPDGDDPTYDGNGDGTPDNEQAHVASLHTADGESYVTLAASAGQLQGVDASENPSPDDAPGGVMFPYGFFDFTVTGLSAGQAISVALYLPEGASVNTYWKYGPTLDNPTPHWYEFLYDKVTQTGAVIEGTQITLYFVDGLRGDDDLLPDGDIEEPGSPALWATVGGYTEPFSRLMLLGICLMISLLLVALLAKLIWKWIY